jgi:hypothetical protein
MVADRVDAVTDDITDDEAHPRAGQRDHVEPVAGRLIAAPRRQIAGGRLDGRVHDRSVRQQVPLEGERYRAFAGEPAGVVQADRARATRSSVTARSSGRRARVRWRT